MLYVEWAALFIVSLLADVAGLFVVPAALLTCNAASEHLPQWAWPWDNDRDGINGDAGWRGAEHANGNERSFWYRFVWLAIRNPSNNFAYKLGRAPSGEFVSRSNTTETIGDQQGHPGWIRVSCDNCWCFYAILPYGSRCVRIALGWKIWDKARSRAEIVGLVNPFARYSSAA